MRRRGMLRLTVIALLGVSLAGNFFALGFVVHQWRSDVGTLTRIMEMRYPPDARTAFRALLRDNRERLQATLGELRTARHAQEELARQKPLDEVALRAAMAEVRIKTTAVQSLVQDYLVTAIKHAETDRKDGE